MKSSVYELHGLISRSKHSENPIADSCGDTVVRSWRRPEYWPTVDEHTDVSNKATIVFGVPHYGTYIAFAAEGDYTVDWGDGSGPVDYMSGDQAEKFYDYTSFQQPEGSIDPVTQMKYGVITIYPTDPAIPITLLDLHRQHSFHSPITRGDGQRAVPVYEMKIALPALSVLRVASETGIRHDSSLGFGLLESVELHLNNISAMDSLFYQCSRLKHIGVLRMDSAVTADYMFGSCLSLPGLPYSDTPMLEQAICMFYWCASLLSAPDYDMPKLLSCNSMFYICHSLVKAPALKTPLCEDFSWMYSECKALKEVPYMDTSSAHRLNGTFFECHSLIRAPEMDLSKAWNLNSLFWGCQRLISVKDYDFSSATDVSGLYGECRALESVPYLNFPVAINAASCLENCRTLDVFNGVNAPVAIEVASFFYGCTSMRYIRDINFPSAKRTASMLNDCLSLVEVTGLAMPVNSTGEFGFKGCYSLTRIQMTGCSQTMNLTNTFMSAEALNEFYTNLPSSDFNGKIYIQGAYGRHSDDPSIATAKGWVVSG